MKTLTTLTAVVALVAGISIANAADNSSMSKEKSMGAGSMSQSARVIGTSKYCLKTKAGTLNCKFASLSACKKGAKSAACVTNPNSSSTTGAGSMKK
jgi:hypothetical protein